MAFPTLAKTPEFQRTSLTPPAAGPYGDYSVYGHEPQLVNPVSQKMTLEGTLNKTGLSFLILLAAGAVGWFIPILALPAVLAGLVLGLVIAFKRTTNPGMVLTYSGLQGLAIGGISSVLEQVYPGIVTQAVLATLCVFAVVLAFYKFGILRTSPMMNKIFLIGAASYLLFGLVNLLLMVTGVTTGMFGLYSDLGGLGIIIGLLGVALASYSLVQDFTFIENGVNNNAPKHLEWTATFGLVATLVWLYVEILRLIAIFRQ